MPEVVRSIGPYDIAVVKADSETYSAKICYWHGQLQETQGNFPTLESAMDWAELQIAPTSNIDDLNKMLNRSVEHHTTEVRIMLPIPPVSFQKSRTKKDEITALIHSITKKADFILTHNVAVSITWYLYEKDIYESDAPPDVDNIIKPILDALCGSEGILIDDCQVQSLLCCRRDWDRPGQCIEIEIEFFDDLFFFPKKGLAFVRFEKGLCFFTRIDGATELVLRSLKMSEVMLKDYHKTRDLEENYYAGISSRPSQRVFHVSRVASEFPVYELQVLENALESLLQVDELKISETKIEYLLQ